MAANSTIQQTGREYVASLAVEAGWVVSSAGYVDSYIWPHEVDLGDGGPLVRVKPPTVRWDETGNLALDFDGEPLEPVETELFSQIDALAALFRDVFSDPAGVGRFGAEQVRKKWVI